MLDLGYVLPGTTINVPFATYDSNDPSASVTTTGLAATDIEIYKDGSLTQRASDAGYAVDIDFDALTGLHTIQIDLSDNTTAGFFAAGSEYLVAVSSITVDAATVSLWAARFTIGVPGMLHGSTIAVYTSTDNFTLNSGSTNDDAYNGCILVAYDVATQYQMQVGVIEDYTGATKTVNLKADPGVFTMTANDHIIIMPPALLPTVAGNTLDVTTTGAAGIDWANVENPTTAVDLSATDIQLADTATTLTNLPSIPANWITTAGITDGAYTAAKFAASSLDGKGDWNVGKTGYSLTATTGLGNQTANITGNLTGSIGSLGTTAKADVNTEVDTALADVGLDHLISSALPTNWATDVAAGSVFDNIADDGTAVFDRTTDSLQAIADSGGGGPTAAQIADAVWDEAQADHVAAGSFGVTATEIADILVDTAVIGAAGAGLTAVPWNASWDAEVQSEVNDGLTAFWTSPATLVDLIWDEDVDTTHQTAGTAGKKLDDAGAAADPWATALPGAYGAGTAGNIIGNNVDAPISTVDTVVDGIQIDLDNATDGLGAIKTAVDACATTTELNKVPKSDGTTSWNATALAAINAEADTALTDYDPPTRAELTTDINTVVTDLDDIKGTGFVKDTHSLVDIEAYVDILDDATSGNAKIATDVANVLLDTNELQTDDVPGLIAALNDIAGSDVLTQVNAALDTAISELGVAAPTATPTVRTALMLMYMALRNKRTTTASADTISNDAGTTIATSTLSDDTVTFTKGEYT